LFLTFYSLYVITWTLLFSFFLRTLSVHRSTLFPYTTLFRSKSCLINYRSPDSIPSYVNDLTVALIEELPKEAEWPFLNGPVIPLDRKSTRLNSSHVAISYAVFCLKKKITLNILSKSHNRIAS